MNKGNYEVVNQACLHYSNLHTQKIKHWTLQDNKHAFSLNLYRFLRFFFKFVAANNTIRASSHTIHHNTHLL